MPKLDQDQVVGVLNRLLEAELAGVIRYTHYSFLVFGFGRIPIVSWMRGQAEEATYGCSDDVRAARRRGTCLR